MTFTRALGAFLRMFTWHIGITSLLPSVSSTELESDKSETSCYSIITATTGSDFTYILSESDSPHTIDFYSTE
jgi:hypothetical protein